MKKLLPLLIAGSLALSGPVLYTPVASASFVTEAIELGAKGIWKVISPRSVHRITRGSFRIVKNTGKTAGVTVTGIGTANGVGQIYIDCIRRKASPNIYKLSEEQQFDVVRLACPGRHK